MKLIVSTVFLFLVTFFASQETLACLCSKPDPISAYESTPIVFIGTVKSIQEEKKKINRFGEEVEMRVGLIASLNVDEAIKGVAERDVRVVTGGGGGDCGFPFKVGEKYLVFGTSTSLTGGENIVSATVFGNQSPIRPEIASGTISTSICTLTNRFDAVQNELEMITAFREGKLKPRIYGQIVEYVYDFDGSVTAKPVRALPNITVIARGAKGTFEGRTDKNGRFRIKDLPVGKYTLKFLLPSTHMPLWDWDKLTYPISLSTNEDSYEADLDTQINATVSGQVRDWRGRPAGEQIQLSLIPVEFADKPEPWKHCRSEYTAKGGYFKFEGVKPGRYVAGISIADAPSKHTPYPQTYFPSGHRVTSAKIIEVQIGRSVNGLDLVAPRALEKIVVEGAVVSADGVPVSGASVNIYDSDTPHETVFGFSNQIKTDAFGHFRITGFKGRRYLLHAYKDVDYLAGKGMQSERIEVSFDGTAKNINLALNKNGIFDQLK